MVQCKCTPIYTEPYTSEDKKGTKKVKRYPASIVPATTSAVIWGLANFRQKQGSNFPKKSKSVPIYFFFGKNGMEFAGILTERVTLPFTRINKQ